MWACTRQYTSIPQPLIRPKDVLLDGFIAHTFSPQDVYLYLERLLRTSDLLYRISYSEPQRAWYITQSSQNLTSSVLDYHVGTSQGIVVPQQLPVWYPEDEIQLFNPMPCLPIFFVKTNNGVGYGLRDILLGRYHDTLCNLHSEARLGGKASIRLHINWPGYPCWECQITTRGRDRPWEPILLCQLMSRVGISVNKFFNDCMKNGEGTHPRWRIRPDGITQDHIKIIGVLPVYSYRWMPIIQLTEIVV